MIISAAEFRKYCNRLHVDLYKKHKLYTLLAIIQYNL